MVYFIRNIIITEVLEDKENAIRVVKIDFGFIKHHYNSIKSIFM